MLRDRGTPEDQPTGQPHTASTGYLEAGSDAALATRYALLLDSEPKLARTLAASVTQRIACGERTGQHV